MKVVGLISGGKDSMFNMMHCVANGHEVVALAHLKPGVEELDSYMYQSVGHNIVPYIAECMGIPLYQRTIMGTPNNKDLEYKESKNDEVEDLFMLLSEIKTLYTDLEAVSVGAVHSTYQKKRVENVANRLGISTLSYLWGMDQELLLQDMMRCHVDAMIIKSATIGLDSSHLGKNIEAMFPILIRLREKWKINVAGEGGEYETLVTDSPLFSKRIEIIEYDIVRHSGCDIAPVLYMKIKKVGLVKKQPADIFDWRHFLKKSE